MKVVVLISGGMDSTTTAALYKKFGHEVAGIFVDYGQRTVERERVCAKRFCEQWEIPLVETKVDLRAIAKSALLGSNVHFDNQPETTVPGRNALLLAIGAAFAMSHNFDVVAIGTHGFDSPYRDTHKEFIRAMNEAISYAYGVRIEAPFETKAEIFEAACKLGVNLEETWSCYFRTDQPCGKCLACELRQKVTNVGEVRSYER